MTTFGLVEYKGNPWCEGARPYVNQEVLVPVGGQTDHGLYLLYWNSAIDGTPIPQDVRESALVEWERRYPFDGTQHCDEWWGEWMDELVSRQHGVYAKTPA